MPTQTTTAQQTVELNFSSEEVAMLQEAADALGCSIQDLVDRSAAQLLETARGSC
jgi:uncharacterized protein (DUF1778 family)